MCFWLNGISKSSIHIYTPGSGTGTAVQTAARKWRSGQRCRSVRTGTAAQTAAWKWRSPVSKLYTCYFWLNGNYTPGSGTKLC